MKCCKLLQDAGYDFNNQNEAGTTLLMQYVQCVSESENDINGMLKVMQFLIDHGAHTDLKNNKGKTAYDLAIEPKYKEFLKNAELSGK